MVKKPYSYLLKFILVGDTQVGKSCLLYKFTDGQFNTNQSPTIGSEFGHSIVRVSKSKKKIKLYIWDTAGQERFRSITKNFFRGAAGVLLVYDITRRGTFQNLPIWLEEIKESGTENMAIMLVGNKCDLVHKRAVSFDEGQEFAKEHGLMFMECSAKDNQNVREAFTSTAEKVYSNIVDGLIKPSQVQGIQIGDEVNQGQFMEFISGGGACCRT